MWKISRTLLILIAFFTTYEVVSQQANSWIDYNQQYYKIGIAQDGLYRITAAELSAAGIPVNSISKTRYQLFRKGKEVALYVQDTNNDQVIEYLEFYAEKNDGSGDTELYESPDAQPNPFYSLFTDTASYFLTWQLASGSTPKRMRSSNDKTSGLPAPAYYLQDSLIMQVSNYAYGPAFGPGNEIKSPFYAFGEGWTGSGFGKNGSRLFAFSLPNREETGPAPKIEVLLTGANSLEHLVDISVGPNESSLRSLGEASFESRYSYLFTGQAEWTDVSAGGTMLVKVTAVGLEGQEERVSVSYVRCTYASAFSYESSRDQKVFSMASSNNARQVVVIPTAAAAGLSALDVTSPLDPVRLSPTAFSDRLEVVYTTQNAPRDILVMQSPKRVGSISHVSMQPLDLSNRDYLIISHKDLDRPVDGVNPVTAYKNYRASTAGGGHRVLIAYIDDIYNQFNYGDPSPVAVKRYLRQAFSVGNPEFLFLIGKGTTVNFGYYRKKQPVSDMVHYLPTYGHPGSDGLFSVGITDDLTPAIPTGRLSAYSPGDVKAYLDKVKEMEALPYDQLWRKNVVQLSGGRDLAQRRLFASYIRQSERALEGHFLGGKATNINKEVNDPVQLINIATEINAGASLVTFFGHSGPASTDVEIGLVSRADNGYANMGKYPAFLINGCNAGEIFAGSNTPSTFGEDWMAAAGKGALAFIANSDYSAASNLKKFSDLFYEVAFQNEETFGMSVGQIVREVNSRYLSKSSLNDSDFSQVYQTVLQGDPAVKVFGAKLPDFEILAEEIYAEAYEGSKLTANADSFQMNLVIRNFGRTVEDSLTVQVDRTLVNGRMMSYTYSFPAVLRKDTVTFSIYNDPELSSAGQNAFVFHLDPGNLVPELKENNNTASYQLFLPNGSTQNLFPVAYATVSQPQVKLVWQSSNPLEQTRAYALQVDTLSIYSSPFLKTYEVEGSVLMSHPEDLSQLPDSTTIYWRTRYAEPNNSEDTTWVQSSFTLIAATSGGWGQFDSHQLKESEFVNVVYDPNQRRLDFKETTIPVNITTHGPESGLGYDSYEVLVDNLNLIATDNKVDPVCKRGNAINAVFFDRQTALPYRPLGLNGEDLFNDLVCGRSPQMIHNLNQQDVIGDKRYLDSLIGLMKERDMVLLFSFGEMAYSQWDDQLKASLQSVGIRSSTIENLTDGQPVIFMGRKGDAEGTAVEMVSNESGTPLREQVLSLSETVTGKFSTGVVKTGKIGPAKDWKKFEYLMDSEPNRDFFGFNVIGVTAAGMEEEVFAGSRMSEIDLAQVDAAEYPYLRLKLNFFDEQDQTPPRLYGWAVEYEFPPEGLLLSQSSSGEEVPEGAEVTRHFSFMNLSDQAFSDSLTVSYTVINTPTSARETNTFKIVAPAPGDTTSFETSLATRGKVGINNLSVNVDGVERELYPQNNYLLLPQALNVTADETNPVLDVTFDGGYILDGDIVSPTPNILIRFKDENEYMYKQDTSGMRIELKRPCEGCEYERVHFTSPNVVYTAAGEDQDFEINYAPGPLEDGTYALRVQGSDESGNESGAYPYEITFEVINESTITNFYPYPNPFSTSSRFVFTLTGSVIPSELKIQIMTISGRVVREITKDEIGPLRIGNNITEYAWDGRDEYGDQLANGVYLYKVFIRDDTEIKHRATSADRGFKHGFGKLYILR